MRNRIKLVKLNPAKKYKVLNFQGTEADFLNNAAALLVNDDIILQLNIKGIDSNIAISVASKLKLLCAEFRATFILNSGIDLAYLIKPDGVILSRENIEERHILEILGENILLGCNVSDYPIFSNSDFVVSFSSDLNEYSFKLI